MGYTPFTNNYTSPDPKALAAIYARQSAERARVHAQLTNGNQVMGALVTDCCSDPAYGGQSWQGLPSAASPVAAAIASLVPGTPASNGVIPITGTPSTPPAVPAPASTPNDILGNPTGGRRQGGWGRGGNWARTPVDILTGTWGFRQQPNGRPWPRPMLPASEQRRRANAFPNYGPTVDMLSLVPPCPCFSSAPPVVMTPPAVVTPAPNPTPAPAPPPGSCPYPGCSTGNVCLDLVTGCVSNSQVDQAQVLACTKAGYGTFGNMGGWLSAIMLGCNGNLPYIGTPLPNPPAASGAMMNQLSVANGAGVTASRKAMGLSGLGQDDSSNVWGYIAILGMAGIVWWGSRKW